MSTPGPERIRELLHPYGGDTLPADSIVKIARYLRTFQHWSSRVNLTTIRDPEQVVQRHFGEGLVLSAALPEACTILDLGSGAGFPGLPIALARPSARVTLAESQQKKSAFLKEAAWMMGLTVSIWSGRAEAMATDKPFNAVVLRAVDNMSDALQTGLKLLAPGGTLAFFAGEQESIRLPEANWISINSVDVPQSPGHIVLAQLP